MRNNLTLENNYISVLLNSNSGLKFVDTRSFDLNVENKELSVENKEVGSSVKELSINPEVPIKLENNKL